MAKFPLALVALALVIASVVPASAQAPIPFPQQTLPTTTGLAGVIVSAFFVTFIAVICIVAFARNWSSRPRCWRTLYMSLIGMGPFSAVTMLRQYGYLAQTAAVWDPADGLVQVMYWDFAAAGWAIGFIAAALNSYIPERNLIPKAAMHRKSNSGDREESSEQGTDKLSRAALIKDVDIFVNTTSHVTGGGWIIGVMTFFMYGAGAFQQAFPLTLWGFFGAGAFFWVGSFIYYAWVLVGIGRSPAYLNDLQKLTKNDSNFKQARKTGYAGVFVIILIFSIVSLIIPWFAAGFSPAVATDEPTYSLNAAYGILLTAVFFAAAMAIIASLFLDVARSEVEAESQSKKLNKKL
jgi:hypothetical protein